MADYSNHNRGQEDEEDEEDIDETVLHFISGV
jgi:ATP-dependent DNA helicase 2 subunit 1